MNKKQKGFTLLELSMIFFIISVIVAITAFYYKPREKALTKLYYNVYSTLEKAAYNFHFEDYVHANIFSGMDDSADFCTEIFQMVNTYNGFGTEVGCIGNAIIHDINATALANVDDYAFMTTNGSTFYFTRQFIVDDGSGNDVEVYGVIVDLNGSDGPNSFDASSEMADRVAFLVTPETKGTVIPIGVSDTDTRYLVAQVDYPYNLDILDTATPDDMKSSPMNYFTARCAAWSNAFNSENIASLNFYTATLSTNDATDPGGTFIATTSPFYNSTAAAACTTSVDTANNCSANSAANFSACTVKILEP